MIFKIHYFSFNAGLSGVLLLITVFLRKYSDASSSEVGTLLMVLPFVSVFTKPFFGALADRHRRYKLYFILALLCTLLGFGAYTPLPFFPQFIQAHGRAAWYLLVVATIVGYIGYGVVWSLGDAYAANVSHRTGESFGLMRMWGTIGWGVAGALVGAVSPYLQLPEMVPGLLVFIVTHILEILLLCWWPTKPDFEMGDEPAAAAPAGHGPDTTSAVATMEEKPEVVVRAGQRDESVVSLSLAADLKNNNNNTIAKPPADPEEAAKLQRKLKQEERNRIADLQMTIFGLVARKHRSLVKYLVVFTLSGCLFNIHFSYFFLHLERLAAEGQAEGGADFSTLAGLCIVAQAVGETLCFMLAPWVVARLGRDGAISLNCASYALRYFGNGLGIPLVSPYVAVLTESLQGVNYGIFYYLITDTALHYALLVDDVIPELKARGLLPKGADLAMVRTSLRATMQGVFSGAFDGLGFGLGSLIAGLVLERRAYEELWCYTATAATVMWLAHGLYELANRAARRWARRRRAAQLARMSSYEQQIESYLSK